jgi:hypothetical protein
MHGSISTSSEQNLQQPKYATSLQLAGGVPACLALLVDGAEQQPMWPVCFGFWQFLATKSCCGPTNAQLFSQLL